MAIQKQIDDLIAKATPLRALDDDDPKKLALTGIVDEINYLREVMTKPGFQDTDAIIKKPVGRPKKGVEGAEA